jgi:hypothetical protein
MKRKTPSKLTVHGKIVQLPYGDSLRVRLIRAEAILTLYEETGLTWAEVALVFGVTRERARQLAAFGVRRLMWHRDPWRRWLRSESEIGVQKLHSSPNSQVKESKG